MNHTEKSLSSYEELIPEFMPAIKGISASFPERYWEDLVQEGLIGLFNAVNSYSEETGVPFRAYANICIRNAIYSACRKIKDDTLTESLDDKTLPSVMKYFKQNYNGKADMRLVNTIAKSFN